MRRARPFNGDLRQLSQERPVKADGRDCLEFGYEEWVGALGEQPEVGDREN